MRWVSSLAARPWIRPTATAAAVGLVALASVLPVWVAQLFAPQYPKGLWLRAYGGRIEGDVREINGLNHYIGMPPLAADAIPELALWPLAVACAIVFAVVASISRGWPGRLAMLGLWATPIAVLADIQRWLYVFGHDLDRDAALRVAPFTPLAIGPTKVWNFQIMGWPGTALLALLGAALIVTLARRLPRRGRAGARRQTLPAAAAAVLTLALAATPADAAPALQALVDAVPSGGELVLSPGTYRGPVILDRPIALRSGGDVTVDGGGAGTVITVRASGAIVEGLRVRGSGGQLEDAAGIAVIGADGVTIARNQVSDAYVAILARGARDVRIVENVILGRGAPARDAGIAAAHGAAGVQADGVSLWDVTSALVRDNRIEGVRDGVYLSYASGVLLDRNAISGARYAVHAMFGGDLMIFENEMRGNASGLVLMYPSAVTAARNTIAGHRALATGYAVLLKDVRGARVIENVIQRNGTALKIDGSEDAPTEVLRNDISYNTVAVEISPRSNVTLSANTFAGNVVPVLAAGARAKAAWTKHGVGNHWADHAGFDVDGDGRSETPQVVASGADRLTAAAPELRALRGSLAYRVFARAERWVAGADGAVIVDRAPLMSARGPVAPAPADAAPLASIALAAVLLASAGASLGWARR